MFKFSRIFTLSKFPEVGYQSTEYKFNDNNDDDNDDDDNIK